MHTTSALLLGLTGLADLTSASPLQKSLEHTQIVGQHLAERNIAGRTVVEQLILPALDGIELDAFRERPIKFSEPGQDTGRHCAMTRQSL